MSREEGRDVGITAGRAGASSAGGYAYRPPSPPHIHIPPASEDKPLAIPRYIGEVNQKDREILQHITQGNCHVEVKDWKYTWRRQAQPILAFLYLGPANVARDVDFLKNEGITMMMAIRNRNSAAQGLYNGNKVFQQLGIPTMFIDVDGNQELIRKLPEAISIMNEHLVEQFRVQGGPNKPLSPDTGPGTAETWGKILVFCESGNERSPAVVVAYLMAMYQMDIITAVQYIQQQRFCVAFDDSLKNLLLSYNQILDARRALTPPHEPFSISGSGLPATVNPSAKRGRDEIDEEDGMDLDDADDVARFGGRSTFAPFISNA